MITIFSSTNRSDSNTEIVARYYHQVFLQKASEEVRFYNLTDLPLDLFHADMYEAGGQSKALAEIQDEFLIPADKFFFVIPEYNGGIPGVLKLMIDAFSIREYKPSFKGKKAGLAGVASGRAGNLRGLDQFTHILSHVGTYVMPDKLPISSIEHLLTNNQLTDEGTKKAIEAHTEAFLNF